MSFFRLRVLVRGGCAAVAGFAYPWVNLGLRLRETFAKLEATVRERADGIPLDYGRRLLAGGRERMGRELNPGERRRVRDGFRGMVAGRV